MYYKVGQACIVLQIRETLLQIRAASLLQNGASFVTNWGPFYKLGNSVLQSRAAIPNWAKIYCKLGQVLQIRVIITNCSITCTSCLTSCQTT